MELNVLWEIMCEGNLVFSLMSGRQWGEEEHTDTGNLKWAEDAEKIGS